MSMFEDRLGNAHKDGNGGIGVLLPDAVGDADKHVLLQEQAIPVEAFPRLRRIDKHDVIAAKQLCRDKTSAKSIPSTSNNQMVLPQQKSYPAP